MLLKLIALCWVLCGTLILAYTPTQHQAPSIRQRVAVKSEQRIVGGEDADIEDFPWQVYIEIAIGNGLFKSCGGSILNENYVLTAQRCLEDVVSGSSIFIYAGLSNVSESRRNFQAAMGASIHNFPGYSLHPSFGGDISVLEIYPPFEFDSSVDSISINEDPELEEAGVVATATGWGALGFLAPRSSILQKVSLPIVSNEEATTQYGVNITGDMIAAGDTIGKSICLSDYGGPLVVFDSDAGEHVLVVVASWGYGCIDSGDNDPAIFARPSFFLAFINPLISETPTDQDQDQELSGEEGSWIFWYGELPDGIVSRGDPLRGIRRPRPFREVRRALNLTCVLVRF